MNISVNVLLWIALVVLGVLYFKSCNKKTQNSLHENPVVLNKIDTVYMKGKTDTVVFTKVKWKTKWLKPNIKDVIVDTTTNDTTHVYKTEVDDSLLTATITSKVKGELLSSKLVYTPKYPQYITRVDTLQISDSTIVAPQCSKDRWGLLFGGVATGNATSFEFTPTLTLKTNKSMYFSVGYGIINKTYSIGVHTAIPNPFKK